MPVSTERGVVYLVLGSEEHLRWCLISLATLRWTGYAGPVTVFTDLPPASTAQLRGLGAELVAAQTPDKGRFGAMWFKTRMGLTAPYGFNLYLDVDTLLLKSIDELWGTVNGFGLAAAQGLFQTIADVDYALPEEKAATLRVCSPQEAHHNSGVLVWRDNAQSQAFFERWHGEWQRFSHIDELALTRARCATGLPTVTLADRFNWPDNRAQGIEEAVRQEVAIWHIWHKKHRYTRRILGVIEDLLWKPGMPSLRALL